MADRYAPDVLTRDWRPPRVRTAQPGSIVIEGRYDAELVEKVWGDDLRVAGVAVEHLGGIEDLAAVVDELDPAPDRRLGVLSRTAEQLSEHANVLVVGPPHIDTWQAVKPDRIGLNAWPVVPRDIDWKRGICSALGWPHADESDIERAWAYVLGRVDSFADLEPWFLDRVEDLIDFVTANS